MYSRESVNAKMLYPTSRKLKWLETMSELYHNAVQFGLDFAQTEQTSSRKIIHNAIYYKVRERFGLSGVYTRVVVNHVVSLARSYYGMRKSRHFKRVSFPKINNKNRFGIGDSSYKIVCVDGRFVLRASTCSRANFIWLPLCVPQKHHAKLSLVKGDAEIYKYDNEWYISFPIRLPEVPVVRYDKSVCLGIDLGIVRLATVATPDGVIYFNGKEIRQKKEHFADIRHRYQIHKRIDRVKAQKGKERHWTKNTNHEVSADIIKIALRYDNPVIVFESLDGIRNRLKGSKRFKRMVSSWAFRQLINFVEYKARRHGIPVIFIDPRGTSKTCSRCGHNSRSNRPSQSNFRCVSCGYRYNADANAAYNIAAAGLRAYQQELPDIARPNGQTENVGSRPDVVNTDMNLCRQTTT